MEMLRCRYCGKDILPGFDYEMEANDTSPVLSKYNRKIPRFASGKKIIDSSTYAGKTIGSTDYRTGKVTSYSHHYNVQSHRDMEMVFGHLEVKKRISGPICEECAKQFKLELDSAVAKFNPKGTKRQIERKAKLYNMKLNQKVKKWIRKAH